MASTSIGEGMLQYVWGRKGLERTYSRDLPQSIPSPLGFYREGEVYWSATVAAPLPDSCSGNLYKTVEISFGRKVKRLAVWTATVHGRIAGYFYVQSSLCINPATSILDY